MSATDPEAEPAKRRRRRNTTLMIFGLVMAAGCTVAGALGVDNQVMVNGQWVGVITAAAGAGLYAWTYRDRIKLGKD